MLWGISEMVKCQSFQTFLIMFSTPENLLVGISGTLGMKESHFLTKNVFWGNAVGYSMLEPPFLSTPEKNVFERKPLSHQKENAVGYLRNGECYSFQTFAIVFSTPENLLVKITGALQNDRKPLSQQKCVCEEMLWGILEMVSATAFKHLSLCSAPLKTY